MPAHPINLIGQRFGRLVALAYVGVSRWNCQCDCGAEKIVETHALHSGRTRSCGCLRIEMLVGRNATHGKAHVPEYKAWAGMIQRCYNPRQTAYQWYGARGVTVCDRWRTSFAEFLTDMGSRPSPAHSLDRIDNNGNYEPDNCRWATPRLQWENKRHCPTCQCVP